MKSDEKSKKTLQPPPHAPLASSVPNETAIAVIRGAALRHRQEAVSILRDFREAARAIPAERASIAARHKQEMRDARAAMDAARRHLDRLPARHKSELDRLEAAHARAVSRAEGAKEALARSKVQLRKHRDPEPYRQASARRRADAMAARVLSHEIANGSMGMNVSAAAVLDNPDVVRAAAPTAAAVIDLFRARGLHAQADALEQGRSAEPAPRSLSLDPQERASDSTALAHHILAELSTAARTAASHLAGDIDATELFDQHTMPFDRQLMHKDISRNPVTPLNWRDQDDLRRLLAYLPEPARTAAVNRLASGVPKGGTNPLYRPDVPPYGHARTFLHARDRWLASDTASRKVAEPGDDRKRHDLADKAAEGIRAQVKQLASY